MYTVCWTDKDGKDCWDRCEALEEVRALIRNINKINGGVEDVLIFDPSAENHTINPQNLLKRKRETNSYKE